MRGILAQPRKPGDKEGRQDDKRKVLCIGRFFGDG